MPQTSPMNWMIISMYPPIIMGMMISLGQPQSKKIKLKTKKMNTNKKWTW